MESTFLTGGTGFVGSRLIPVLAGSTRLRCLVRDATHAPEMARSLVQIVPGTLGDSATYLSSLDDQTTIVHLAAVTGKARASVYREVNVEGTHRLLDAAVRQRVRHFIFVSSIAAGFPDQRYYPYGQSKRIAEDLVRSSGVPYTILRPTMVFGAASPVLVGLARLSGGPVPFSFGPARIPVQPIAVQDIIRVIALVVQTGDPTNDTIEVGGPDVLPLRELLLRIRAVVRPGGATARLLTLPLAPLRFLLGILEPVFGPLLPLTAGQLATFANAGTAAPHGLTDPFRSSMQSLDSMLAEGVPRD